MATDAQAAGLKTMALTLTPDEQAQLEALSEQSLSLTILLNRLRADEGDSITLLCDNPEGPPNNAVECCGAWTDWTDRRFEGETLDAAIRAAWDARAATSKSENPSPVRGKGV